MALQDYWIDLYFVEKVRQPDGTGGFEYVYQIGDTFKGGAVKSATSEQLVAGVRGEKRNQYTMTTKDNNALSKGDVVMFVNANGNRVFVQLNDDMTHTPDSSGQADWKYGTATEIKPDLRVVG